MSDNVEIVGGFEGDPAEAFAPADGGGCCGSPAAYTATGGEQAEAAPCCGTSAQASVEGACCGASAKAEALASGAGCCG